MKPTPAALRASALINADFMEACSADVPAMTEAEIAGLIDRETALPELIDLLQRASDGLRDYATGQGDSRPELLAREIDARLALISGTATEARPE